jgi:hypothetical protein
VGPVGPCDPVGPAGIEKFNIAAEELPALVTDAAPPGGNVVVVPI